MEVVRGNPESYNLMQEEGGGVDCGPQEFPTSKIEGNCIRVEKKASS